VTADHATEVSPSPSVRHHGLDFVRASMMLLGVVLHTALCFQETPGAWIYQDPNTTPLAGLLVVSIHVFRMPIFFAMAGFFGAMLLERRSLATFAAHRFNRIAVPLLVGWFVLFPMLAWAISFAWKNAGTNSITAAFGTMSWNANFADAGPMHLWFLVDLLWFYAAAVLLSGIGRVAPPIASAVRGIAESIAIGRLRWFRLPILVAVAFLLMLPMKGPGIDTTESWRPEWHIMALYGLYFAFGWLAHGVPGLLADLQRWCWVRLAAGVLSLLFATIATIACYVILFDPDRGAESPAYRGAFLVAQLLQAATACLLLLGLAGASERVLRRANPAVRYLVDASYWIYLLHLPLTIFIPALFRRWEFPGLPKMLLMMALVTIPLLVTYHVLVRGTAIGATLSGRTYPVWPFTRTRAPEPPPTE
jgi:glucan biosynthesis protein C